MNDARHRPKEYRTCSRTGLSGRRVAVGLLALLVHFSAHGKEPTMAEAVEAAAESLAGSPLLHQGRAFYKGYIGAAGEAVRDLIVALNTPEA